MRRHTNPKPTLRLASLCPLIGILMKTVHPDSHLFQFHFTSSTPNPAVQAEPLFQRDSLGRSTHVPPYQAINIGLELGLELGLEFGLELGLTL